MASARPLRGGMWVSWVSSQTFIAAISGRDLASRTDWRTVAGPDGGAARWAMVCSLITTAKLNDGGPFAYLKDVLERMSSGHPMSRLDELLLWNWTHSNS